MKSWFKFHVGGNNVNNVGSKYQKEYTDCRIVYLLVLSTI